MAARCGAFLMFLLSSVSLCLVDSVYDISEDEAGYFSFLWSVASHGPVCGFLCLERQ